MTAWNQGSAVWKFTKNFHGKKLLFFCFFFTGGRRYYQLKFQLSLAGFIRCSSTSKRKSPADFLTLMSTWYHVGKPKGEFSHSLVGFHNWTTTTTRPTFSPSDGVEMKTKRNQWLKLVGFQICSFYEINDSLLWNSESGTALHITWIKSSLRNILLQSSFDYSFCPCVGTWASDWAFKRQRIPLRIITRGTWESCFLLQNTEKDSHRHLMKYRVKM